MQGPGPGSQIPGCPSLPAVIRPLPNLMPWGCHQSRTERHIHTFRASPWAVWVFECFELASWLRTITRRLSGAAQMEGKLWGGLEVSGGSISAIEKGSMTSGGIEVRTGSHLEVTCIPLVESHCLPCGGWPGRRGRQQPSPTCPQKLVSLMLLHRMGLETPDLLISHSWAVLPATCLPLWGCRPAPLLPQQWAAGPGRGFQGTKSQESCGLI